ncbi:hypothetical protein DZA28_03775 [Pseudomonas alloputida]|uniref:Diguanylate cyclase n=1 Tax=Pseudomonas alloputida TaxID=1940621 RepID=A0ABY3D0F9_9PSED|nr:hypothetical protein DBL03_01770 [Pseudomonas putida]TRZ59114.1 hypothetical protein DZA28_03775 [Pseudomonas alloputida]
MGAIRGHTRPHRYTTGFNVCGISVGAGVPAKRPVQASAGPARPTMQNAHPAGYGDRRRTAHH